MTVSELSKISSISERQIQKNWEKIPDARKENGIIIFPEGSRYPCDLHRYKFNNQGKRRAALLDAISRYRYVDYTSLRMSEESFKSMIEELTTAELIRKNGASNSYGANGYDTTIKYAEIKGHRITKRITEITKVLASAAGAFVTVYINK